jgi:hypothetical protein
MSPHSTSPFQLPSLNPSPASRGSQSREARTHIFIHVVSRAPATSHDRIREEVRTVSRAVTRVRKAERRPLCFYGGVFPHSFFNKKAVRGLSPKAHVALRLRYPKTSLFVYFECDSLSEELEKEEVDLRRNFANLGNSV